MSSWLAIVLLVVCSMSIILTSLIGLSKKLNGNRKCFWKHNFKVHKDYELEKSKLQVSGNKPLRISLGGFTTYKCENCGHTYVEKWRAW